MKSDSGVRRDGHRNQIAIAFIVTAFASLYYLALLTDGDWNLFGTELCALVFNDMLAHLLRGDVTLDPAIIRGEAYVREGRTFAYWGIFPALLRLPLVPFDALYELQVARLSCWAAIAVLATSLVATLALVYRRAAPTAGRTLLFHLLVVVTLFAGTIVTNLGSAYVYNEPVFWAVALSVAFNYLVLKRVLAGAPWQSRDLIILAGLAGLALNCRVLEGIGLYLALGWIMFLILFGGDWTVAAGLRRIVAPAIILGLFVAICGTVNYLRWGSPATFMDLHLHVQVAGSPERLAGLNAFGSLNPVRVPFAFAYYFLGVDIAEWLPSFGGLQNLYDGIEGPASAFIVTNTVPLLLAGLGVGALFRQPVGRPGGAAILAGVILSQVASIFFLLSANYISMRYRMDFIPAMSLAAAAGYFFLTSKDVLPKRTINGVILLAALSIVTSHISLVQYKDELRPSKEEARLFWERYQCAKAPEKCPR